MRAVALLVLASAAVACSSPSTTPSQSQPITVTRVTGTYAGQAVATNGTIGLYAINTAAGTYAGAIISNVSNACSLFQSAANVGSSGPAPANATQLTLNVLSSDSTPVGAGTYSVSQANPNGVLVNAAFAATDAMCEVEAASASATSGTVQIATASSTMVTGTFDVTFPSGDHLTGQFAAPVCNFDLNALEQNGLSGCSSADAGP
jgi:hypothetical protein